MEVVAEVVRWVHVVYVLGILAAPVVFCTLALHGVETRAIRWAFWGFAALAVFVLAQYTLDLPCPLSQLEGALRGRELVLVRWDHPLEPFVVWLGVAWIVGGAVVAGYARRRSSSVPAA
jgi:hypothetical protein